MATTKRIEIELAYSDADRIIQSPPGVFRGGVPDPCMGHSFGFHMLPVVEDREGGIGPDPHGSTFEGRLQINVWGTSADFRELGRYLLAIAELDTSADPGFHQHHDDLRSDDGRTQLDLIVRKLRS